MRLHGLSSKAKMTNWEFEGAEKKLNFEKFKKVEIFAYSAEDTFTKKNLTLSLSLRMMRRNFIGRKTKE
jgi:hypothetical protein